MWHFPGVVYSRPFPRRAPSADFGFEVQPNDGREFTITVEHHNLGDTTWRNAGPPLVVSTPGVCRFRVDRLMEEIRYRCEGIGGHPDDSIHLKMLAPAWRP